jgi:hypothetical protein
MRDLISALIDKNNNLLHIKIDVCEYSINEIYVLNSVDYFACNGM